MEISPGERLGPYEVQGRLGRGGMGVVYGAKDIRLERTVALKVLPAEMADDPERRKRLVDEARAAASLSHPNICTLYEVGEHDGHAFIAMEHIPGSTIARLLRPNGMPAETALRYGIQIADALAYAHDHNVVHRDLKCTNVMVTPEGLTKVVDFGLAKRLRQNDLEELTQSTVSLTHESTVVGTLAYMAPEALAGEATDGRCDIWALGVLLQIMLSGRPPFAGRTAFELTAAILRESPSPLSASVPPGLRSIVRRCLAKEVTQRYQRAGEVRAALESVQEDLAAAGSETIWKPELAAHGGTMGADDTTLAAGDAWAPPVGVGEPPQSASSIEIEKLDRIAGALNPIVGGAKAVAAVAVGLVVLGFLGFITSATFGLALHAPIDGSALDYLIFGVRAMIPTVVLMMIDAIVLAVLYGFLRLAIWLMTAASRRASPRKSLLRSAWERLESMETRSVAAGLVGISVVALLTTIALSWPVLRAIERLVEFPADSWVDTSVLSPSNQSYHLMASWGTATVLLTLIVAWSLGMSIFRRRGEASAGLTALRVVGVVSLLAVLTVAAVPWRMLWANERERVALDGRPAYVVSHAENRLFLYVPDGVERYLVIREDDQRLERMKSAGRENIFAEP